MQFASLSTAAGTPNRSSSHDATGKPFHPGIRLRQVDDPGLDVDRPGQAQPDTAQAVASTRLDQLLQQLRQPCQPGGRAVGERERDVRDRLERASRQDDADPRVSATDVGGHRVLVRPADPQHLAGATAGRDVGALLGEDAVLEQLADDVRDGRGRGAEQLRDLGAAGRLTRCDEFQHPRTEVGHDFLQSRTKTTGTAVMAGTLTRPGRRRSRFARSAETDYLHGNVCFSNDFGH